MPWTFAGPCGVVLSGAKTPKTEPEPNQIEYAMNCKTQKFCIKQEKYIWIGSSLGLVSFSDGKNVRTFFSAYYVIFHISPRSTQLTIFVCSFFSISSIFLSVSVCVWGGIFRFSLPAVARKCAQSAACSRTIGCPRTRGSEIEERSCRREVLCRSSPSLSHVRVRGCVCVGSY